MNIIIASHGDMSHGILNTLKMFVSVESVIAIGLDDRGIESFRQRFEKLITASEDYLVLTDIEGGSPYQTALGLKLENAATIEIVCGVNLPMAIEAAVSKDTSTLEELKAKCFDSGKLGISIFENNINTNSEDE